MIMFPNNQLFTFLQRMLGVLQDIRTEQKLTNVYLQELARPTLNGFAIFTQRIEDKMDLQINDDGKGIVFTATPTKNGQPVTLRAGQVPTWTLSQAGVLNLSVDPTGLIATGTLPTPPVDGTGFTATISLTLADNTVVTDASAPFDIVQDPDNVDSFTIQEAAQ